MVLRREGGRVDLNIRAVSSFRIHVSLSRSFICSREFGNFRGRSEKEKYLRFEEVLKGKEDVCFDQRDNSHVTCVFCSLSTHTAC